MAEEVAFPVDDVGIAEEHGRTLLAVAHHGGQHHTVERVGSREAVAGIQEDDIIACRQLQTFIHRIVETVVRLALDAHRVSVLRLSGLFPVGFCNGHGIVRRRAVDDEMFHMRIVLHQYTV